MHARTRRQQEVLDIISRHTTANGYRPSYQQIATLLRLRSRAGIARIVQDLEQQGLLARSRADGHFSIEVASSGNGVSIPWIRSSVSDDEQPVWANDPLDLPEFMIGDYDEDNIRVFRVTDAAMAPMIQENDIAIIETRDYCRDDQQVVAEVAGGKILLRNYYRVNSEVELRPVNPTFESIFLPTSRVRILGVQRGLIRLPV